jgi:hypothetical protein
MQKTCFGAATGRIGLVVGRMTRHLTNGAWATPKRATAVVASPTARLWDVVLVSNKRTSTRSHNNEKDEHACRESSHSKDKGQDMVSCRHDKQNLEG